MAKRRGGIKSTATKEKEQDIKENGIVIEDKGLRLAWIKFIDAYIANGGNGTEAYKIAYPDVASDKVAQVNASRLLSKAIVREELENKLSYQRVTDDWIGDRLMGLVELHYAGKGAIVSVKALELLAKIKGLLVDTKKIAFTGENPAVFLPVYTPEEKAEFEKIRKKGQRITE